MSARQLAIFLRAALCLGLAACASPNFSFPVPVIPPSPTPEDWPDAGVAVLESVATLEFRSMSLPGDEQSRIVAVLNHRKRLKVLTQAGVDRATVTLPIDGYSTVTRVVARSVSPDGQISNMSGDELSAVMRENEKERAPEVKLLKFTIPDAAVGGLLEYRYERIYVDPLLVPPWIFADDMPVLHSELGVVVDPSLSIDYRFGYGENTADKAPLKRTLPDGRERLVFIEKDVPPYYFEPHMPNIARTAPWITITLRPGPGKTGQYLTSWNDVAEVMTDRLVRIGRKEVDGSVQDRYRRIRDSISPLPLPGMGVRQPIDAVELMHESPACTRDATALLLGALSGIDGIIVRPALVSSLVGPPLVEDFPGLYPFVRAVVAVEASDALLRDPLCSGDVMKRGAWCSAPPGGYIFLDPMCTSCRFGEIDTDLIGGRALVFLDHSVRWVDVPVDPPERNMQRGEYHLALDVDGNITGTLDTDVRGVIARELRGALRAANDRDRPAALRRRMSSDEHNPVIKDVKPTALAEVDQILHLRATVASRAQRLDYERFKLRTDELVGAGIPGTWRQERRYPAILDMPRWTETTAVITLPAGFQVENQPVAKIATPFAEYAAGYVQHNRALHYSRRVVFKSHVIKPADWPAFYAFIEQVRDLESTGPSVFAPTE